MPDSEFTATVERPEPARPLTPHEQLTVYVAHVLGFREGFLVVATKVRGKHIERRLRWPEELPKLVRFAEQSALENADLWVCPLVRSENERRKGTGLPATALWSDLDGPAKNPDLRDRLKPLTVASGSPGREHIYVRLSREIPLGWQEALNRALAVRLGGDTKWTSESLLRLPGTVNTKHRPPAPVVLTSAGGDPWEPEDVAELLGVDLAATPTTVAGSARHRSRAEIAEVLSHLDPTGAAPCWFMARTLERFCGRFDVEGERYATMRAATLQLPTLAARGHRGLGHALRELADTYDLALSGDRGRDPAAEFERALHGGVEIVAEEDVPLPSCFCGRNTRRGLWQALSAPERAAVLAARENTLQCWLDALPQDERRTDVEARIKQYR